MKSSLILFLLFGAGLWSPLNASAQQDVVLDSIVEKIRWYAQQKQSASFFVHFDKTIYTTNENVWFTGYLLSGNDDSAHQVMSVALVRNSDRSVLTEAKFFIVGTVSFGNLVLPDSLPTGDYNFVCFTNRRVNGFPEALFVQPVTIKSADISSCLATLTLIDDSAPNKDSTRILIRAYTPELALLKNVPVNYFFGAPESFVLKGTSKTNNFGEATVSVPSKLITATNNILIAEIRNGKEVKSFSVKLPVKQKEVVVKFYPEGGRMVNGVQSKVGWEVTNTRGEPVKVAGDLYADGQKIMIINTDEYGLGSFNITPVAGSNYYVRLVPGDTPVVSYNLPAAFLEGPVIHVLEALAKDSVRMRIFNLPTGTHWKMLIHNYREIFLSARFVSIGAPVLLKMPLDDMPIGLNTITLVDEKGRPWAERLFFAHPQKRSIANISTDSTTYSTRQKVFMKLLLTAENGVPIKGLVSVACVQDNRLDAKKLINIEDYTKVQAELAAYPYKQNLLSAEPEHKSFLENLLLVKGWRRYTWQDLLEVNAIRKAAVKNDLLMRGFVTQKGKPIKKQVSLFIQRIASQVAPTFSVVNTDSAGKFNLSWYEVASIPYKPVNLVVNLANPYEFGVTLNDDFTMLGKSLASYLSLKAADVKPVGQAPETLVLPAAEGAKKLLDVKVIAKKDNYLLRGRPGRNACGDYVCLFNILNCQNHFDGFEPVVNATYFSGPDRAQQVYTGCAELTRRQNEGYHLRLDGVFLPKEYYVNDFTKTDPADPQYVSTIYWNYSLLTNEKGEAEVSFYTSDIPGKFRIVTQGITAGNVVYGEKIFEVRKKQ